MSFIVLIKKNRVTTLVFSGLFLLVAVKAFIAGRMIASGEIKLESVLGIGATNVALVLLFFVSWVTSAQVRRLNRQQTWLIDATNWNIERLKSKHGAEIAANDQAGGDLTTESRWPWGSHHTETLGHLEAAAKKWWVLYDPSDFTTAPTNDMVSEWLQTERGISRDKARAIASMLRPDKLPTGPRR